MVPDGRVTDKYSIVISLLITPIKKAFQTQKDVTGLIVYSDQGYQYTSYPYHLRGSKWLLGKRRSLIPLTYHQTTFT